MMLTLGEIEISKKVKLEEKCFTGASKEYSLDRIYFETKYLSAFINGQCNLYVDIYTPNFDSFDATTLKEGDKCTHIMDSFTLFKTHRITQDNLHFMLAGKRKQKLKNPHLSGGFAIDLGDLKARVIRVIIRTNDPYNTTNYKINDKRFRPVLVGTVSDDSEEFENAGKIDLLVRAAKDYYVNIGFQTDLESKVALSSKLNKVQNESGKKIEALKESEVTELAQKNELI